MQNKPILVIGSTGKTGSRVAAQLEAMNVPVRHGTRRADTPFDWEDDSTWAPALEGVSKAYVTYFPDLAFPGAVEKVAAFCEVAKTAGLEHIVLLSGRTSARATCAIRSSTACCRCPAAWFRSQSSTSMISLTWLSPP